MVVLVWETAGESPEPQVDRGREPKRARDTVAPMTELHRRLVDRILDPDFLAELEARSIDDLRSLRNEAREAERELSFERRLCHARIDILSAELDGRSGGNRVDLVDRLPEILAAEPGRGGEGTPLPSRAPDLTIPRNAQVTRRRVQEILGEQTLARLPKLPSDEIKRIISSLAELEKSVSARRRVVHDVLDTIQAEIVRRYTSGEADPAAALG